MTVIKHEHLQKMAEALDEVIEAAEGYKAYLKTRMEGHKGISEDVPPMPMLRRQLGNVERFIDTADNQMVEQLINMVNAIETLELAERGEFV